eukprot:c20082_g1_i2 orf=101-382(-)
MALGGKRRRAAAKNYRLKCLVQSRTPDYQIFSVLLRSKVLYGKMEFAKAEGKKGDFKIPKQEDFSKDSKHAKSVEGGRAHGKMEKVLNFNQKP